MPESTGSLKILQRLNSYEFGVEIAIMREGVNRNKWDYRNVEKHYKTFLGQPILIAYVGNKIGDGHNMQETKDENGNTVYTFVDGTSERIIGTLSEDENDFRIEERSGDKWIVAKGKIFAFYAREAVEKIMDTGSMDVSAETDVYECEDGENGVEVFTKWAGLGVTILGDDVPPAIPGARIKKLARLKDDYEEFKLRAASLIRDNAEDGNGNIITEPKTKERKITHMNKRELAALSEKFGGYTAIGASDDGMNVVLMKNEDSSFWGYTFNADDGESVVVPERIHQIKGNSAFMFGEIEVLADTEEIVDGIGSRLIRANSELESMKSENTKLNEQIQDMVSKEHQRRIDAAKTAVNSQLEKINANRSRGEQFSAELAQQICAKIDNGCFVDDEADGKWCGDKNAVSALMGVCMMKQCELDADKAAKKQNAYSTADQAIRDHGEVSGDVVAHLMSTLK